MPSAAHGTLTVATQCKLAGTHATTTNRRTQTGGQVRLVPRVHRRFLGRAVQPPSCEWAASQPFGVTHLCAACGALTSSFNVCPALTVTALQDFTPVCTTELGEASKRAPDFASRGVKMVALSCDPADSHSSWYVALRCKRAATSCAASSARPYNSGTTLLACARPLLPTITASCRSQRSSRHRAEDIAKHTGGTKLAYPIIADPTRELAVQFDMLDEEEKDLAGLPVTVRSVFVIGPDKKVKLMLTYPPAVGRNFDEVRLGGMLSSTSSASSVADAIARSKSLSPLTLLRLLLLLHRRIGIPHHTPSAHTQILRAIDALQLGASKPVATPVNWTPGSEVMVLPSVSDEDAAKLDGYRKEEMPSGKGYMRFAAGSA